MALGGETQGDEILVVVVLVVAAQTDEDSQLVVFQLGAVGHEVVGVDKHLQPLVLAKVDVDVLIDGLRLVLAQILHHQAKGLLVVLGELWLVGVGHTRDARRQHVGHGLALGVLLDVDGAHLQGARLGAGAGLQVLLVLAPCAAHQVERAETQHDVLFESGQEHTHEADGGEVVDGAFALLVGREGDAVLIPAHGDAVVIAQLGRIVAVVHDIAAFRLLPAVVGLQLVVADGYAVLVVALILVQGVVLVQVFHVGAGLVAAVVALALVLA